MTDHVASRLHCTFPFSWHWFSIPGRQSNFLVTEVRCWQIAVTWHAFTWSWLAVSHSQPDTAETPRFSWRRQILRQTLATTKYQTQSDHKQPLSGNYSLSVVNTVTMTEATLPRTADPSCNVQQQAQGWNDSTSLVRVTCNDANTM